MAWNGEKDEGPDVFTEEEAARVVAVLLKDHFGPEHAIVRPELATKLGLPGKTLRAVLSYIDGRFLVLAYKGVHREFYVCPTQEHAANFSAELKHHALSVLDRYNRRGDYWQKEAV